MKSCRKWRITSGWTKTTYQSVIVVRIYMKSQNLLIMNELFKTDMAAPQDSRRNYEMEVRNQATALERQLRRGGAQVS